MSQVPSDNERRRHIRYPVRTYARLHHGNQQWETHLLDMSVSGARLALLDEHLLKAGDHVSLIVATDEISLAGESYQQIHLQGTLVHLREHLLGVAYEPASPRDEQLLNIYLAHTEQH